MGNEPRTSAANDESRSSIDDELSRSFGFENEVDAWMARVARAVHGNEEREELGEIAGYRLLSLVARGGQGTVFRAVDPRTGRNVAIKRLPADFESRSARARFEREAEVVAALRHPNIVTLFAAQDVDDHRVLVMEWIDGAPFDRWADDVRGRESSSVAVDTICGCAASIADAVAHAHRNGVIHRDLKPSNVLIDASGAPHVVDFGLARVLSADASSLTEGSGFLGTPSYAAPEQVAGRTDVDARADIHALGAMLYRALVGAHPFDDRSPLPELFRQIADVEPSSPSRRSPGIRRDLSLVVMKALAKEPARRYQSMDEFAADLRRYRAGERVSAHPNELTYILRKAIRRHRGAFALGAALVLLLVAATIVSSTLAYRLSRERAALETSRGLEERARRSADDRAHEAESERDRADRTKAFLQDMFATVRSAGNVGEPLTVANMLDLTRETLDRSEQPPEVEADLRETLARAYGEFGDIEAAAAAYERAIALRRAQGRSRALAASLVGLGELLRRDIAYAPAMDVLREAIEIARDIGNDELLIDALDLYARCANDLEGPGAAIAPAEEALAAATLLGDAWRRANALSTHALIAATQSRNADATRLARESVANLDLDDPQRATEASRILHNVAFVAITVGDNDLCIESARRCVAMRDRMYGRGDSRSLTPWAFVARAYAAKKDFAASLATFEDALAAAENHPTGRRNLLNLRRHYCGVLEATGIEENVVKAEAVARLAIEDWLAQPDASDRQRVAQLAQVLGRRALARGGTDEFRALYAELPARVAAAGGGDCAADLVRVYLLRDRPRRTAEDRDFARREAEAIGGRAAVCTDARNLFRYNVLELTVRARWDVRDYSGALEAARLFLGETELQRGVDSGAHATAKRWVAELEDLVRNAAK